MKVALVGGDRRAALLAQLLWRDGHRVRCYALEKAPLPAEIPRDSCLPAALYGADAVILPVPTEKGPLLNTPLSAQNLTLEELWGNLWPEQWVFGGGFGEASAARALQGGQILCDLLRRPGFVTGNAALTAEAAVGILIRESEGSLRHSRCLLLGCGRIGKLLARKLAGLGADVTVMARKAADRALIAELGDTPLEPEALEGRIGDFDLIVNTVPARVLSDAALCCIAPEALLLELASPPGGFNRELAKNIGLRTLIAPGLPGQYSPLAAARLMRREIEAALEEGKETLL